MDPQIPFLLLQKLTNYIVKRTRNLCVHTWGTFHAYLMFPHETKFLASSMSASNPVGVLLAISFIREVISLKTCELEERFLPSGARESKFTHV